MAEPVTRGKLRKEIRAFQIYAHDFIVTCLAGFGNVSANTRSHASVVNECIQSAKTGEDLIKQADAISGYTDISLKGNELLRFVRSHFLTKLNGFQCGSLVTSEMD